jgi:predicted metal-dependent hydrolase
MQDITVRQMDFGFPDEIDPVVVPGEPEWSYFTVAFDVYDRLYGGYVYRLFFATYGQWHMSRWLWRATRYMLETDPRTDAEFGGAAGRRMRVRTHLRLMRKHLLPKALRT